MFTRAVEHRGRGNRAFQLSAAGAIREVHKLLRTQHHSTHQARADRAGQPDAITWAEASTDLAAAASGGPVRAMRLDKDIYSGRVYRSRHRELEVIGAKRWEQAFCPARMRLSRARSRR